MRTTAIALILAFVFGALAVVLSLSVASSPALLARVIPLVALGVAPLPSLAIVRPPGFVAAVRLAAILQVAVVFGAGMAGGVQQGTDIPGAIGSIAIYGFIEFALVTIPVMAIFKRVFSRA